MSIFLKKHWKKVILSLTAAFWASCDSDINGTTPSVPDDAPNVSSSSEAEQSSSAQNEASSSSVQFEIAPVYGVVPVEIDERNSSSMESVVNPM